MTNETHKINQERYKDISEAGWDITTNIKYIKNIYYKLFLVTLKIFIE